MRRSARVVVTVLTVAGGAGCEPGEGGPPPPGLSGDTAEARDAMGHDARKETEELVLTLAGGAEEWGDRYVPWQLSGTALDSAVSVCVGASARGCIRWGQLATSGTWRAPATPGNQTVYAWWRGAVGGPQGPFSAEIFVDGVAPEIGTVDVSPVEGGLELSWSGFTDAGSGIETYRIYAGEGVSAPRCADEGTPDWEGSDTEATILGLPAEQHTLRVCAVDGLGNVSVGALVRATPEPETDAPIAANFVISEGAEAVPSRSVTLHADVTDASALRFCASETATTSSGCSVWQNWSDGVTWRMSSTEGEHTVRAWFRDPYGNMSDAVVDTVVLDRSRPQNGTLEGTAGSGSLALSWSGFTDTYSEITEYIVVTDDIWAPSDCESGTIRYQGSDTSTTVTDLAGGDWVGVRVCAVDALGHVSSGANQRFMVNAEGDPPVVNSFVLNGGAAETYQRRVSAAVSATDASGLARMCFSTDASLCYAWEAYAEVADVLLPNVQGEYTVYLWVEDAQGLRTPNPASATVTWRPPVDVDGDGAEEDTDCDDNDASRYPGADEVCDGVDNDCDGDIDEGAVDRTTWYTDADGDGHGDADSSSLACEQPDGSSATATDCDDSNARKNPDVVEGCGVTEDLNCDGEFDPEDCGTCLEILDGGVSTGDGLYTLDPDGDGGLDPVETWCDMTTDGGGWTLVQRSVWDWDETSLLQTDFDTWRSSTLGDPRRGGAFRMAGRLWELLNTEKDHMFVHVPRDRDTGESCDELVYLGWNGTYSVSETTTTLTGIESSVTMANRTELSTVDSGPSTTCVNNYSALPWFYAGCCTTCPTFKGSYWTDDPHPMAAYLDTTADAFGNTSADVCSSGAAVESRSYEGINEMEYYLR